MGIFLLNQLIKSELSAFLDYENYERGHQFDNVRNGSCDRKIDAEFVTIYVQFEFHRIALIIRICYP